MIRYSYFLVLIVISCTSISKPGLNKKFRSLEQSLQDHTGFILVDPTKKKELYSFQANQYFTPASNTKIFTLYAGLMILGDSVPALQYVVKGDSLIFRGTGDPSFLYQKSYNTHGVFDFLSQSQQQLYLVEDNFFTASLGPGWAWDDLVYSFSAERSAFPVYGNTIRVEHDENDLRIIPRPFKSLVTVGDSIEKSKMVRDIDSNQFALNPGRENTLSTLEIPFRTGFALTAELLSDSLNRKVSVIQKPILQNAITLYSIPVDSLYKVMMQESDNFIAEQLLLLCAGVLSDSLKPEIAIEYMKEHHLNDLPDKPIWVDGSGLSRYNLFTPRSIVMLWDKIYRQVPAERLFPLLAIGGKAGTVKNAYKNDPPYIYGKTGTLTNNHCLSGFLVTKKGRTLIFSFMSNNHPASASVIRKQMEVILKKIHENY